MTALKGYDKVKRKLNKIQQINKDVLRKDLLLYASTLITGIQKRTQSGKSPSGSSFAPYSASYKTYRDAKGKASGHRSLTFRSDMLNNITKKTRGRIVVIYFSSDDERKKAEWNHNGNSRMKATKFFTLDRKQRREAKKRTKQIYKKAIK